MFHHTVTMLSPKVMTDFSFVCYWPLLCLLVLTSSVFFSFLSIGLIWFALDFETDLTLVVGEGSVLSWCNKALLLEDLFRQHEFLHSHYGFFVICWQDAIISWFLVTTVEPVYSGHLQFLENLSAIARYPLHRVSVFFREKTLINVNPTAG